MKTRIRVNKDFDWLKEDDILTFNIESGNYEITKVVNTLPFSTANAKIKEVEKVISISPSIVEKNEEFFEISDAVEDIDMRDFEIAKLKREVQQLKQFRNWF